MADKTKAELAAELEHKTEKLTEVAERFNALATSMTELAKDYSDIRKGPTMWRAQAVNDIRSALLKAGVRS